MLKIDPLTPRTLTIVCKVERPPSESGSNSPNLLYMMGPKLSLKSNKERWGLTYKLAGLLILGKKQMCTKNSMA